MGNGVKLDSLSELETYARIVEKGSLVGAAQCLGITPNAVSRRLAVLEERVNRRLIHRTTRQMSVTEEGQRLYQRCRRVLEELQDAEREWIHLALTWGPGKANLYQDGAPLISKRWEPNEYSWVLSDGGAIGLGASIQKEVSNHFHGRMDEFRLYNRMLTKEELEFLATKP